MTAPEHERPRADEEPDAPGRGRPEGDDAYERAQPQSQPRVSSEPEPDDDPANAG